MSRRGISKGTVTAALSKHIGRARGITAEALVREILDWLPGTLRDPACERHLRSVISMLREDGVAICGHPSTGYFIAATAEELEDSCRFLRSRAMHSLQLEARLRKITLPDLIGQLHLPT